jgi:hypothetical protein
MTDFCTNVDVFEDLTGTGFSCDNGNGVSFYDEEAFNDGEVYSPYNGDGDNPCFRGGDVVGTGFGYTGFGCSIDIE